MRFRERGIGQHVAAVLAGKASVDMPAMRLIGVIDPALPPLGDAYVGLFDAVSATFYTGAVPAALISPSPMTHSSLPLARALRRSPFSAAIVYDFIPIDHQARYLADPTDATAYLARLAWLKDHDFFLPISAHTASRLQVLLGVRDDRMAVTGVGLRKAMLPTTVPAGGGALPPYILACGGDDWRKNIEAPVAAHARSARLAAEGIRLVVAGRYPAEREGELRRLHAGLMGRPELLTFSGHLSDPALRSLYADAMACVVPSRVEGFSVPVIEAAANGTPVLAADGEAHAELLPDPRDRFAPDDVTALQLALESLAADPATRAAARGRQEGLASRFALNAVAARFWAPIAAGLAASAHRGLRMPAVARNARPRIAFLTPLPPDASGVADYSAACLPALTHRANVHVFTSTTRPSVPDGLAARPTAIGPVALLSRHFDAAVCVVGNSGLHRGIVDQLLSWGGAVIAHDARMLDFYVHVYGYDRACAQASAELGRPVSRADIDEWLAHPGRLPTLFLDEIAHAARPLIVHSQPTATRLVARGLPPPVVLPFSPYRVLPNASLSSAARLAARRQLGLPENEVVIATFGAVSADRAPEDLLWALETLRAWGVAARLVYVGAADRATEAYIQNVATSIGVAPYVMFTSRGVSDAVYRLWLAAADLGVQLRTYQLGGLSGALLDCMAAGLPTVTTAHLAAAMDAPHWVRAVPDSISAVLVAEALMALIDAGAHFDRNLPARAALLRERNFDRYADGLLTALGCAA
ncbi:glycosyl transferase [Acidisphaera rubrifaciens HS-AP3]|uniref:Glycosyl transferase n=2 Tax=Acidisphaera TaxID=50714 RepID=A0A0D6P4V6_9PROT|nr:glycosyl transferase [Acidisphaera rubrifaciens HS-AP3]